MNASVFERISLPVLLIFPVLCAFIMQGFFSAGFGGEPPAPTKAPRQAPRALADPRSGGSGSGGGSGSATVKREPADGGAASAQEKSRAASAAKVLSFCHTQHFDIHTLRSQSRQHTAFSLDGHKYELTRLVTSTLIEEGGRKGSGQGGVGRYG